MYAGSDVVKGSVVNPTVTVTKRQSTVVQHLQNPVLRSQNLVGKGHNFGLSNTHEQLFCSQLYQELLERVDEPRCGLCRRML
jgi:hypothetical protein